MSRAFASTRGLSLAAYTQLIRTLLGQGYRLVDYAEAEPASRHLILRHDVDLCTARARILAELEARENWYSTYFVLLRGSLYSLLEEQSFADVRWIAQLGHRIGLHLDASLYAPQALEEAAARECETLERWVGAPVEMISFHRPAKEWLNAPRPLAGRPHAYMPRYFSEMGYVSDSRGGWHHGEPLEHAAVQEGRALQLLTHPVWWVAEPQESAQDKLRRLSAGRSAAYAEALASQIQLYPEELPA